MHGIILHIFVDSTCNRISTSLSQRCLSKANSVHSRMSCDDYMDVFKCFYCHTNIHWALGPYQCDHFEVSLRLFGGACCDYCGSRKFPPERAATRSHTPSCTCGSGNNGAQWSPTEVPQFRYDPDGSVAVHNMHFCGRGWEDTLPHQLGSQNVGALKWFYSGIEGRSVPTLSMTDLGSAFRRSSGAIFSNSKCAGLCRSTLGERAGEKSIVS